MTPQLRILCSAAQHWQNLLRPALVQFGLTHQFQFEWPSTTRSMYQQAKESCSSKALTSGSDLPPLKDGTMRLYSMRFCPFAHRARLVLACKKIEYETINIHLADKPKWFVEKKNPNAEVPVVEKDGKIVYDSLVVAEYLDGVYKDPPIVATDPLRKAHDAMVINFNGSKVVPNYYKIINSKGEDEEPIKTFMAGLQRLEDVLAERKTKFFGGDSPGFVDFMIWPWQERLGVLKQYPKVDLSLSGLPCIKAWHKNMKAHPAVTVCAQTDDMHTKFITLWKGGDPNPYDVGLSE